MIEVFERALAAEAENMAEPLVSREIAATPVVSSGEGDGTHPEGGLSGNSRPKSPRAPIE